MKITTAAQGAGSLFDAGVRSWHEGLSNFQRAQLRSLEQGSYGASLEPYGSLAQDSITQQKHPGYGSTTAPDHTMAADGYQQVASNAAEAASPLSQPGDSEVPEWVSDLIDAAQRGSEGHGAVAGAEQQAVERQDTNAGAEREAQPERDSGSDAPRTLHNPSQDSISGLGRDSARQAYLQSLLDDDL